MGAIQGMGVSSVAATNLGPRFGLVNLPFLINSFEKLDKFVASGQLFDHFMMAMDHQGIMGIDITGYGHVRRGALRAHATQIDPTGAFWGFDIDEEEFTAAYPWEDWILARSLVG